MNHPLASTFTTPWAIKPDVLLTARQVYARHLLGERADLQAIEAKLGRPLENKRRAIDVHGDVAVLPLQGILARRMNLMMQISGGTSTQTAAADLQLLLDDESVRAIVLDIDSPGGTVDGTQSLADAVRAGSKRKPIVSVISGIGASAAYWVASAAPEVYATELTTQVGSIGVVATHVDVSGAEAAQGLRTTEITAGRYKRIASQHAPLSDEGRQTLQAQVDYTYSLFVEEVAENRGASVEQVLQRMADGRIFLGRQAVRAGLIDGIVTLDEVITSLNGRR